MHRQVLIYGPNAIRGQVIEKALSVEGIGAKHLMSGREVENALAKPEDPIVILDVIGSLPEDLPLRERLAERLPGAIFITLIDAPDASMVCAPCGVDEICVLSPVDPRYITHLVQEILNGKMVLDGKEKEKAIASHINGHPLLVDPTQKPKRPPKPSLLKRLPARLMLRMAAMLAMLCIGIVGGYVLWCFSALPDIDILADYTPYRTSILYSDDNRQLTDFSVERRTLVSYGQLPASVTQAVLAIEDTRYFKHSGIDPLRIIGALVADLKAGSLEQGASTITQQLTKMIFLTPEKTLFRKVREILLAIKIEQRYDKTEILEFYLNKAYFGARAYGIDMASRTFFNKSAQDLSLPEAALLAGMLKAPSTYSPFGNPEAARQRRNIVLRRMLDVGFIDAHQFLTATRAPLPTAYHGRRQEAAYFVDHCRRILEDRVGERLYTSGLSVYTTLDYDLQQHAEAAVSEGVAQLNERYTDDGGLQAALVSIEIDTGRIKAMVGGSNFWDSQFNRATLAKRQPGSAFKPIVYITALEQGYDPETLIEDVRTVHRVAGTRQRWSPRNYHHRYHGLVTLEKALSRSMNAATVNLAYDLGIDTIIKTAHRLGIDSDIHRFYPSVLGASETTLMELVCAYAAMASGYRVTPVCIDRIIDRDRAIMLEPDLRRRQVLKPEIRDAIRAMLRKVVTEGTGRRARSMNRDVYGKTGTTNGSTDALFIGFDDRLATGVWVGRDDNTAIGRAATGSNAALPIWMAFMSAIDTAKDRL